MKDTEIKIGNVYDIKVAKNTTAVRIMKPAPNGGWEAVSLSTNKPLVIKSADRVVGPHNPKADKTPQSPTSPATGEPGPQGAQQRASGILDRISKPLDGKRLSALDAAAKVLAEADGPLNCRQLIETMTEKGYWTPNAGKTPANTLHAAIATEIKKKGTDARFEKVGRGQFGLANR